eukprot:comp17394_c0_seq1/m.16721 comp17394_c0_seq1/g.16721  ORF comp17394_c0_seq1/g.16721 comp17394_c0_seq1/m.16721 type:complete len:192 (-) comp17394_c0_seq1:100-675(-)
MAATVPRMPGLVVFDLDATLWYPEMYHLWGSGGAPFRLNKKNGNVVDRSGTEVYLMGQSRQILHELKTKPQWMHTRVAVASSTDEPEWARECLALIEVGDGIKMKDTIHFVEISKSNKKQHFQRLHEKTGVAYNDIIFYDNEMGNIRNVSQLGVVCVYTPDGLTGQMWQKGLKDWAKIHNVTIHSHPEREL